MLQPVISKSRKNHFLCGTMYADKLQLQKKTGRIERLLRLFFFETCFKKVILDPWSWGNEYKAFSDILTGPLTLFRPVFFVCVCASCGGGGGGGRRSPAAAPITSKTLTIRPPKLNRIMFSSFPTSRHDLIGTVTSLWLHIVEFRPPQSEKFLNSEVSNKIKIWVNTLVTFNNSCNVMLDPPFWINFPKIPVG